MPTPLTLANVEMEADTVTEALMEAINNMYRALHKIEALKDRAVEARADLRAKAAG